MGTDILVLWLAREGTYLRESKSCKRSMELLVQALDKMLAHDKRIRISIEPKPNEPMDHAYIPTIGHALAIAQLTRDAKRVGCLIETAHCILAGLDPADEIEFAMTFGKLWSLHLNDQNGLKFDQDKPFGSTNLRRLLIDQTSTEEFEPTKYKDTVRERVMEAIQEKVQGQAITSEPAATGGGDKILDLMEALKASLSKGEKGEAQSQGSAEKPERESRKKKAS
jgi:hypothetical protein